MVPETIQKNKYIGAVGRRKTAVARVKLYKDAKQSFTVNGRSFDDYFKTPEMQRTVREALETAKLHEKFSIVAIVRGGGQVAQSEALRHGIARALVSYENDLRKTLKQAGFLKRDPRSKERKKFGLKGARRAPQWSKR